MPNSRQKNQVSKNNGSIVLLAYIVYFLSTPLSRAYAEEFGRFAGYPEGRLVGANLFELSKDFEYYDPDGRTWRVSAPFTTDGASIPRIFWSFVGNPLGDNYRYAAIVHDYFCRKKYPDWKVVHQNFYNGMRAMGVDQGKAWVMYKAVYWFARGCRWENKLLPVECRPGPAFSPTDCIVNRADTDASPLPALKEINKANLNAFIEEIIGDGYGADADVLREQPDIRRILSYE